MQVVVLTLEDVVRLDDDLHVKVTRGTAVHTGGTFPRQTDALPVVDAGGNADFKSLRLLHAPRAVALRAGIRNDFPGTLAVRARLLHGEETGRHIDGTGTVTVRASLLRRPRFAACTVATVAFVPHRHANVGLHAVNGLLQRHFEGVTQVVAAVNARAAPRLTRRTAAEEFAEDVAEVAAAETAEPAEAACAGTRRTRIDPGLAEAVVSRLLLRIRQYLIGFAHGLELFFRRLVPVVAVRVVLHRKAPVGLLNFLVARIAGNAQYLVIILICHSSDNRP